MKNRTYCLERHFAAFYRQAKCGEPADFTEPCEKCELINECHADWENILPLSDGISLSVACEATGHSKDNGYNCPKDCIDYDRHIQSSSFCNLSRDEYNTGKKNEDNTKNNHGSDVDRRCKADRKGS